MNNFHDIFLWENENEKKKLFIVVLLLAVYEGT